MNGKYISVAEFAEKSGVSKQSIYYQLQQGRRLYPYSRRVNGQRMIRIDALSFYTAGADALGADQGQDPEQQPEAAQAQDPIVSLLMDQLKVKDEQLKAKDDQLAAKDAQLADLTETVKRQTAMQYSLQKQIALLTGSETAPDGPQDADPADHAPQQPETAQRPTEAPGATGGPTRTTAEAAQTAQPQQPESQDRGGGLFGFFRRLRGGR